jgi:hypothetical protein
MTAMAMAIAMATTEMRGTNNETRGLVCSVQSRVPRAPGRHRAVCLVVLGTIHSAVLEQSQEAQEGC